MLNKPYKTIQETDSNYAYNRAYKEFNACCSYCKWNKGENVKRRVAKHGVRKLNKPRFDRVKASEVFVPVEL